MHLTNSAKFHIQGGGMEWNMEAGSYRVSQKKGGLAFKCS